LRPNTRRGAISLKQGKCFSVPQNRGTPKYTERRDFDETGSVFFFLRPKIFAFLKNA